MSECGLQTNFNALIDQKDLNQVRTFGFQWARLDCQTCDHATMYSMIEHAGVANLRPLPIVYDLDRLNALTGPLDVEWGNEPDGDIFPSSYRRMLDEACKVAAEKGLRLWAPAISNLDADSLLWLRRVLEANNNEHWPEGLYGITAHRYGNGTFEWAHNGFDSREEEVETLIHLCQGLPFMITEFGYPSGPISRRGAKRTKYMKSYRQLSEQQQAQRIEQEWWFWSKYAPAFLYQINDGTGANESYGIRRCLPDGTLTDWKPAAYTVPKGETMPALANITPNTVFSMEDLIEIEGRDGEFGLRCPPGAATILSPKTSGNHELRDMSQLGGPDETCKVVGDLVYFWQNSQGGRFAWRIVDEEE